MSAVTTEKEAVPDDHPVGRHNNMLRRLPIGVRLRQYRESAGLSPSELHRMTVRSDRAGRGVNVVTICRLEAGTQTARIETVKMIADALSKSLRKRIRVDDLYAGGGTQLTSYVERERRRRGVSREDYATLLELTPSRYDSLLREAVPWHPIDLPGVVRALPEAYPLVIGALAEYGAEIRSDDGATYNVHDQNGDTLASAAQ